MTLGQWGNGATFPSLRRAPRRGILLPGAKVRLRFSVEQTKVAIQAEVVRMDMGIGAGLRFHESTNEVHTALQQILERLADSEAAADRKRSQNAAAGRTS